MRGRVQGRATKWLRATVNESIDVGKSGMRFEIWQKWRKKDKKLGTLTVSVGGLRWRPESGKKDRRVSWDELSEWFEDVRT
jgi:hypothetical protein